MLNWVRRPQRPFVMPIFISLPAINLAWNPVIKTQRHGSAIMKPVKPINQQRRVWLTSAAISGFGLTITPPASASNFLKGLFMPRHITPATGLKTHKATPWRVSFLGLVQHGALVVATWVAPIQKDLVCQRPST